MLKLLLIKSAHEYNGHIIYIYNIHTWTKICLFFNCSVSWRASPVRTCQPALMRCAGSLLHVLMVCCVYVSDTYSSTLKQKTHILARQTQCHISCAHIAAWEVFLLKHLYLAPVQGWHWPSSGSFWFLWPQYQLGLVIILHVISVFLTQLKHHHNDGAEQQSGSGRSCKVAYKSYCA